MKSGPSWKSKWVTLLARQRVVLTLIVLLARVLGFGVVRW
jgi:hypothetical protein